MEELKTIENIMGLIDQGFSELQSLQVQPTMSNVTILHITMMNMREAFGDCKRLKERLQKILEEVEKAKEAEGEA